MTISEPSVRTMKSGTKFWRTIRCSKGLWKGLATRYYSPLKSVGKYEDGCDYLIKNTSLPKAYQKTYQRQTDPRL